MKTRLALFPLLAALSALPVLAGPAAKCRNSTWLGLTAKAKLSDDGRYGLWLAEENRFGERSLDYVFLTAGLDIRASDWLTVTPCYQHFDTRRKRRRNSVAGGKMFDREWGREDRPGICLTPSFNLFGWRFADRNWFYSRNFSRRRDFMGYRNRLTARSPWEFTSLAINPYVSGELFLSTGKTGRNTRACEIVNQFRASAGATAKLTDNLSLDVYYLLQDRKSIPACNWHPNHVFGCTLTLSF